MLHDFLLTLLCELSAMDSIRVMHIVDSLATGGRERVAVNLSNCLPRDRYRVYLCTTRRDGPLADEVSADIGRLRLERKQRFEIAALWRLVAFARAHNIQLIHAHDASLFIAVIASFFPPYPAVVWHDHYGGMQNGGSPGFEGRLRWLYGLASGRISAVIAVNQLLAEWSRHRLRIPAERIWYIPNFVCPSNQREAPATLPGTAGTRIVCVANLRAQKDHLTLLRAMACVIGQAPTAHLLLVGAAIEPDYYELIQNEIAWQALDQHVSLLGERHDVSAILKKCDIGVLSSASEGLPLALLEYGMAGLPVVATHVGQCPEVLEEGQAGILVPSKSPDRLAEALLSLLQSPNRRDALGQQLHRRVQERYSPGRVSEQVCQVYEAVLSTRRRQY
jgi:glycosyltransferase involved in cell wall biosynthesis